jgi:hypothetical protein
MVESKICHSKQRFVEYCDSQDTPEAVSLEGSTGQTAKRPNHSTAQAYPTKILAFFQSA